jgi:hypothetical protein
LIDECAWFAFHRTGEGSFGYKISSSDGIFIVELTALFITLRHIGDIIQPLKRCLILTEILISIRAQLDSSGWLRL